MYLLLIILLYAIWSAAFPIAKLALHYSSPLFLTGARMLLGGMLLTSYLSVRDRSLLRLSKKQWISVGLLALFSIYLTNILEFWALQYLSPAKACFIYSLSPFCTAIGSYVCFGEKMNLRKIGGLTLAFLAFLPILFLQTDSEVASILSISLPTFAMLGAVLFSVSGWIILRATVRQLSPIVANGISMLIGGAVALLHSFSVEQWPPVDQPLPFVGWLLLITFLSNILCYNLYGWLLKRFSATFLSLIGLSSPIFASIHSFLFLQEPFSWPILFSTIVIFLSFLIFYQEEKKGY